MTQVLITAAAFVTAIAAIVGSLGILVKSPYFGGVMAGVWRRNVSDPIGHWNHHIVRDVVDERIEHLMHNRNNGSSLLDLAEAVETVNGKVERLLNHDAERDVKGMRYGNGEDNE